MMDTTKMKGRLLLFDKHTSNKTLFPKNCEITYAEKIPVISKKTSSSAPCL